MVKINQLTAILLMILCTIFASTAHILLKFGTNRLDYLDLTTFFNWPLLLGLAFFALGSVFMMIAFRFGELSVLLPILSTSYVWISLFSPVFFVADSMNLWKWIGVIIILISVSLLGFASRSGSEKVSSHG